MPHASAAAEPLLLPPGVRDESHGLRVGGGSKLAYCVVTVLPTNTAPAWRSLRTAVASLRAMLFFHSREPAAVGQSNTSKMSLIPTGIPCSGPRQPPARISSVAPLGLRPRPLAVHEHPGPDAPFQAVDAVEAGVEEVEGGGAAGAEFVGRRVEGHGHRRRPCGVQIALPLYPVDSSLASGAALLGLTHSPPPGYLLTLDPKTKGNVMPSKKSLYDPHPGLGMEEAWIARMPQTTGKSLEEWVRLLRASGPAGEKERRQWLKTEHGVGTNYAMLIAEHSVGKNRMTDYENADALVEAMFAGKEGLRPVYDRLLRLGKSLGKDVKACPCKTIVPLYRNHVFAQLKPSTKTRLDLGLALKDEPAAGRLIDTGGRAKGDRITHRIAVASPAEIDEEVQRWLQKAYEMDG